MTSLFISSTRKDLFEHRQTVLAALRKANFNVIAMEDFGAQPGDAMAVSEDELRRADLVVGIYALRYGYCPEGSQKSVTEMEYDWAVQYKKPLLCFVLDETYENFEWLVWTEQDLPMRGRLNAFLNRIKTERVVDTFTTPDNLAAKVVASITRFVSRDANTGLAGNHVETQNNIDMKNNSGFIIGSISGGNNKFSQKG